MSTDDTARSQATVEEDTGPRIEKAIDSFKAWADEQGIPFEVVLEALGKGSDESLPPFHTSVVWADVYDHNGVKMHAVVRRGATHRSLMTNLLVASEAFETLFDTQGWLPADRKPKTDEELAEMQANTQAKLDRLSTEGSTPSRARGENDSGGVQYEGAPARVIKVEAVIKTTTQSGKLKFVVQGWPWNQYGVTCWPDSGKISKLASIWDLEAWEIGEDTSKRAVPDGLDLQAVVRLKEDDKPDKVVDWLGDGVLSEELEEAIPF